MTRLVTGIAIVTVVLGIAFAGWLINRPEHPHRRPSRVARAWWWCRAWAAYLRWNGWYWVARAWVRLRPAPRQRELSHEDAATVDWVDQVAAAGLIVNADGFEPEYGLMPAPVTEEVTPHEPAAPEQMHLHALPSGPHVSGAGGAPPPPALSKAVTGHLDAGWAIHAQLDDTGAFTALMGATG